MKKKKTIFLPDPNGRGGNCSRFSISPLPMQRRLVAFENGTKSSTSMFAAAAPVEPPVPPQTCSMTVTAGTVT
ncbi:MAG: hypothetical protein O7D30_11695 [Rickettsia endosymbiont of Ixodes persulcatus]|nr:hypothetical protein [Rickettsia endosymbiont of Ixodes persulcatus]